MWKKYALLSTQKLEAKVPWKGNIGSSDQRGMDEKRVGGGGGNITI